MLGIFAGYACGYHERSAGKPYSLALAVSHATILAGRLMRSKIIVGLGVMGVIVVFNASYSALTPVICTEIFPMNVRAKGTSLAFFTEQTARAPARRSAPPDLARARTS